MIGITTSEKVLKEKCAGIPRTFGEAAADYLKPTVEPAQANEDPQPAQRAGRRRRTRRRSTKKQAKSRKTRKQ
jgi:hypothetical protein